ncbi:hypothetical protein AAF712_011372 [Marasmius tenuissimus]|uniref:GPI anchored protein n=1 Tax=Marasmius tenuissimus TaxID=585030 RepID=A0ABR2ZLC8_9AGAR
MKFAAFGLLSLIPLLAQAADVTLVQFVPPDTETTDSREFQTATTATDGFIVPIGTNGAETTYVLNIEDTTAITTTISGVATTSSSSYLSANTIVASASGFKGNKLGGWETIDCRYTGDKVGECAYVVIDEGQTQTATITGSPVALIVPVSEKSGGAAPTTTGSGGGSGNGNNGAMGIAPGKMFAGVIGGLVMGAYAVL